MVDQTVSYEETATVTHWPAEPWLPAVVRLGRSFMRHLIDTMAIPKQQHHWVHLNLQCKANIAWWLSFVRGWNGMAFLPNPQVGAAVVADASSMWDCGAYTCKMLEWFQLPWLASWSGTCIAAKELLPLVMAARVWGKSWPTTLVQFWSDNQAAVAVLSTHSVRDPQLMHLLRCLFFFSGPV